MQEVQEKQHFFKLQPAFFAFCKIKTHISTKFYLGKKTYFKGIEIGEKKLLKILKWKIYIKFVKL